MLLACSMVRGASADEWLVTRSSWEVVPFRGQASISLGCRQKGVLGEGVKQQELGFCRAASRVRGQAWLRRADQSQMGCMNVFLAALAQAGKWFHIPKCIHTHLVMSPNLCLSLNFLYIFFFCSAVLLRSLPQLCNQNHITHSWSRSAWSQSGTCL